MVDVARWMKSVGCFGRIFGRPFSWLSASCVVCGLEVLTLAGGCSGGPEPLESQEPPGGAPRASRQFAEVPASLAAVSLEVRVPAGLDRSSLEPPTREMRGRIDQALRGWLAASPGRAHGHIILFVDQDGRPILPNRERGRGRHHAKDGGPPPSQSELTFTFDSDDPWSADELATLESWVSGCYGAIRPLYGPPAFANVVNVRKFRNLGSAAGYSPSTNEILVDTFEGPVLCHEIVHAFHDDDIIGMSSWEEGMARAMEVEACARFGIYDQMAHDYYYDVAYANLNTPAVGAVAGNLFAGWSQVVLRYQLAGYAWAKPMLEDAGFFARFNASLYEQAAADSAVLADDERLTSIAGRAKATVENLPFATWKARQYVLGTSPETGDLLYLRASDMDDTYISLLHRDPSGAETNLANVEASWTVTDHAGVLVGMGTGTTSAYGGFSIEDLSVINYWADHAYGGRMKITVSATVNGTWLEGTKYLKASPGKGVFGVVVGADAGSILFTPLDTDVAPISAAVTDGAFQVEDLGAVRGRIEYVYTSPEGKRTPTVVFTKDDTPYFVPVESNDAAWPCEHGHGCCKHRPAL